jgi:tRNA pseudouridine55 synthase
MIRQQSRVTTAHHGPARPPLCGLLIIDKPEGPTAMDVCARVRSALRRGGQPKGVKVGHGGTLDPLATGVMVVLCGKATTLCERVMRGEKRYQAVIDLALTSNTDDREGVLTPFAPVDGAAVVPPTRERVEAVCSRFVGTIQQRPPAFSALNIGGRRAYTMAREGTAPPMAERPIEIHELVVTAYEWPKLTIDVRCGKGTYIRSLARDIGAALGVGGMLWTLRRTAVGQFTLEGSIFHDRVPRVLGQEHLAFVDVRTGEVGPPPAGPDEETSGQSAAPGTRSEV